MLGILLIILIWIKFGWIWGVGALFCLLFDALNK